MPQTKRPAAERLQQYVMNFPDFETDGNILFCKICSKQVSADKIFLVKQHLASAKHVELLDRNSDKKITQQFLAESFGAPNDAQFAADLCEAFLAANIPLNTLLNAKIKYFLEKYTLHKVPTDLTLRTYQAREQFPEKCQIPIVTTNNSTQPFHTPKKRVKTTENSAINNIKDSAHMQAYSLAPPAVYTPPQSHKTGVDNLKVQSVRDASDIFGEYVASKHRIYNYRGRSIIEHSISQVLFDADMGNYMATIPQTPATSFDTPEHCSPMENHFEHVSIPASREQQPQQQQQHDVFHETKPTVHHHLSYAESEENNDSMNNYDTILSKTYLEPSKNLIK